MLNASLIALLLVLSVVSAVSPRHSSTFIQEQQQDSNHDEEETPWVPRNLELDVDTMSCPSKPQEAGAPKAEWPELEGKTAAEAKAALEQEAPGFKIQVIGPDMMATADYRCDRIRIWLNKEQRVSQPPRVG